jgi:hypothetical protein
MSYNSNYNTGYNTSYQAPQLVSYAAPEAQATFYRKTYSHVAIALLAFIAVETALQLLIPQELMFKMIEGKWVWMFVLGGFWLGSMLAQRWTQSQDRNTQYMGLAFYVFLEALIFLPMIAFAMIMGGTAILAQAGIITLALFGGLTALVFFTRVDFSFLRSVLVIGGFVSLGLIVAGAIFGFNLGLWFSLLMVGLAGGGILYETYNIKNVYQTDQYVGAALQMFSSIMLLYWYVLRILLSLMRRN